MAKLNLLLLAVLVAAAALAGCSGAIQVPERVNVEVAVPCVKAEDVPERPQLRSEADLLNMPRGLRTLALWSDWLKLKVYAAKLEAIATGCSRLSANSPAAVFSANPERYSWGTAASGFPAKSLGSRASPA